MLIFWAAHVYSHGFGESLNRAAADRPRIGGIAAANRRFARGMLPGAMIVLCPLDILGFATPCSSG